MKPTTGTVAGTTTTHIQHTQRRKGGKRGDHPDIRNTSFTLALCSTCIASPPLLSSLRLCHVCLNSGEKSLHHGAIAPWILRRYHQTTECECQFTTRQEATLCVCRSLHRGVHGARTPFHPCHGHHLTVLFISPSPPSLSLTQDLSVRRHQVGVFSPSPSGPFDSYGTTYERFHQLRFTKGYEEMKNHQLDAPSGATHNNVATSINPKDIDLTKTRQQQQQPVSPSSSAALSATGVDGGISAVAEDAESHPFVSDYKSTFVAPDSRYLGGIPQPAPHYVRDFKVATHAIPPPFGSDSATQEEHQPFSGSGYTTNNAFAYDTLRTSREPSVSHYKQTFLGSDPVTVPTLGDGGVDPAPWRKSNTYTRLDKMPSVHSANEGAQPWLGGDWESHSRSIQRASDESPHGDAIPTRTIQRPGSVATNQTRRRRIQASAFSRSERGPPCDGLGTEHMKLRLGGPSETGLHHLSTRPHTAGSEAAPFRYHSAHTHRVAPTATRIGTGIEEAQQLAQLKQLKRIAPADYYYELADAPRYKSTYSLLHDDKFQLDSAKVLSSTLSPYTFDTRGRLIVDSNDATSNGLSEPSLENGGVRNVFETTYQRVHREIDNEHARVRAQGHSVARPQETGYTINDKPRDLLHHRSHTARSEKERYKLTSHQAFQHPSKHASDLPSAHGSQINTLAPLQSSYSREHTPTSTVFPAPTYHSIRTIDGRNIVVRAQTSDLHPTVIKALKVKECAEIGNWGGERHALKPETTL